MIKISLYRDLMSDDPKKIKSIIITHWYYCGISCYCDHGRKCKYRKNYTFHNLSVRIHLFFEYRLHIKLPHLIYISKEYTDLSGTSKCPCHKSRFYTCTECKYSCGVIDGVCTNKKRETATPEELECKDPDWGSHMKCGLFEKTSWADDWDKDTGKYIY